MVGDWARPVVYTLGLPYNEVMSKPKRRTLYIKNPAAHSLAEKVSKKMGVTMTDAVIRSLEAQLRGPARPIDWKKVDAITRKLAAMPILDSRTDDEILGYDEFGIPR
jgi:antitoxin VapB